LAENVSLEMIGHDPRLEGYTGADLSALVNESVAQAIQELFINNGGKPPKQPIDTRVHLRHFHASIEKIRSSVSEKVNAMFHLSVMASCLMLSIFYLHRNASIT
jgi:SpoVK/Ycf46/Vps4 family AAA+-type ATPase